LLAAQPHRYRVLRPRGSAAVFFETLVPLASIGDFCCISMPLPLDEQANIISLLRGEDGQNTARALSLIEVKQVTASLGS
jgi:hypothetical protein